MMINETNAIQFDFIDAKGHIGNKTGHKWHGVKKGLTEEKKGKQEKRENFFGGRKGVSDDNVLIEPFDAELKMHRDEHKAIDKCKQQRK